MKKLTHKTITTEILKLSANYPNPKTNDELQILANLWLEDFSHISTEIFLEAIKLHRRNSKYFPTIADILSAYQEVIRNKPKPISLPSQSVVMTEEEKIERDRLIAEFKLKRNKIGNI